MIYTGYSKKRHVWGLRGNASGKLVQFADKFHPNFWKTREEARWVRKYYTGGSYSVVKIYLTFEIHAQ